MERFVFLVWVYCVVRRLVVYVSRGVRAVCINNKARTAVPASAVLDRREDEARRARVGAHVNVGRRGGTRWGTDAFAVVEVGLSLVTLCSLLTESTIQKVAMEST